MSRTESLGELISTLYEEYLDRYRDTELACVATATAVEQFLAAERAGELREAA